MNRQQATRLFTLITEIRHMEEMCTSNSPYVAERDPDIPACLLAEGMRHGLFTLSEVRDRGGNNVFHKLFGCTLAESTDVVFHVGIIKQHSVTTGENYYKAGKELLIKYGYADLFETAQSFHEIMEHLRMAVSVEY